MAGVYKELETNTMMLGNLENFVKDIKALLVLAVLKKVKWEMALTFYIKPQ